MTRSPWFRCRHGAAVLALAASCVDAGADTTETHRRAGDVLRFAMPTAVIATESQRGDHEGVRQFGTAWIATLAATDVLKRSLDIERPDRTDRLSFPSGHASNAFAAATYVHRRHGFRSAWAVYGLATYVGYTRVQAERHRWIDVAGSLAVAAVMSRMIVTPKHAATPAITVPAHLQPAAGPQIGIVWRAAW